MKTGIDIGSKIIKYVVLDNDKIIDKSIMLHNGDIFTALNQIKLEIFKKHYNEKKENTFGVTGSYDLDGIPLINTILSSTEANQFLQTGCKYIIYIGCETFYYIKLDEKFKYKDHIINSDCASGTGSFIDQQAERLGLSSEKLSDIAYSCRDNTPSIATRCAVFAKSDIIHAQTNGYKTDAIAAGICEGVAGSIIAHLLRGKKITEKVFLAGGVSLNKKIVSEFKKTLSVPIIVNENSIYLNAIGAALLGSSIFNPQTIFKKSIVSQDSAREKLSISLTDYPDFSEDTSYIEDEIEITIYKKPEDSSKNIYIGIDIGSTSTKLAVIDNNKNIITGLYTRTKADPVRAVFNLIKKTKKIFSDKNYIINGIGTTGSGRKLIEKILNADTAINEITAHAKGASFIDPEVDTIIEIGGQDSKFTTLKYGNIINAVMNYVCAAGTGSFIEEQAKKLEIDMDDISRIAMGQIAPYTSDRCTVYMERDINQFLAEGWTKSQLITSVLYSVRDNYLSKVVGKNKIGNKVYFQGATGKNKALVAAFENELKKPIIVSKYCHLTGAIGTALYLLDKGVNKSCFSGFDLKFTVRQETCTLCTSHCNLSIYNVNGNQLVWGMLCGREYESKKAGTKDKLSLLEKKFNENFAVNIKEKKGEVTVGIPDTLYMVQYLSLFQDFFQRLGFNVKLSKKNQINIKKGRLLVNSDFCTPIVNAHGAVESLLNEKIDFIFFPSIINEQNILKRLEMEEKYTEKITDSYFCYYSEYAPSIINNIPALDLTEKLISPKIKFNNRSINIIAEELALYLEKKMPLKKVKVMEVFKNAWMDFNGKKTEWKNIGKKIVSDKKKPKIILLGRPYVIFDPSMNLNIPWTLESFGFELLHQSMIENSLIPDELHDSFMERMHWYYGQEILLALKAVMENDNIYPVFLTCFRCSPDSYLITYFKEIMEDIDKPYLIIQLDELTGDAGYQTRIEAAVETFKNDLEKKEKGKKKINYFSFSDMEFTQDKTVLIPYISPIISELQKMVFQSGGYKAVTMPLEKKMINTGYRYATGGECMPNVAIIGSVIETIRNQKLDPGKCIVFMPTLCLACNFNQFPVLLDLACKKAELHGISISNPNAASKIPGFSKRMGINLLSVNILSSILYKIYFSLHPYELEKGSVEKVMDQSVKLIEDCLNSSGSLFDTAEEIKKLFQSVMIKKEKKPLIGILGDLYVKYNTLLNNDIYSLIEELGGEVVIPSYSEIIAHFIDADIRENSLNPVFIRGFLNYEKKFENIFSDLLGDNKEPPINETINLLNEYGIEHFIAGETTISLTRMLYYIKHRIVDAVIHVNPVFCCPGVVSTSIFKNIQKDFNIPIIDIFYDGSNKPNKIIVPHMYYLKK
ncbi:MAG: hypothetical protein JXB50_14965 [Spirochaetes bacterium]|nr:hypothetical protein [Spirochaetota bacterium]